MIIWVGTCLAAISTTIRTRLQYRHNQRLYVNDYLICLALIFHVILSILFQLMSPPMYSFVAVLSSSAQPSHSHITHIEYYLRLQFAVTYIYWSTLWLVKLALLTFFWRLFESLWTHARLFWKFMCTITVATWIISIFLLGFACKPPSNLFIFGKEYYA